MPRIVRGANGSPAIVNYLCELVIRLRITDAPLAQKRDQIANLRWGMDRNDPSERLSGLHEEGPVAFGVDPLDQFWKTTRSVLNGEHCFTHPANST